MDIALKETDLLINEWQLGQQLNHAVHNGTRVKFNLLLSLLSDDARDFAQFSLPDAKQHSEALGKRDLRAFFSLAPAQPLVNKGMSAAQAQSLNANLQKKNLCSIRLQLLLTNEALLSRSEVALIPSDITDNLPFLSQQRLLDSLQTTKPPAAQTTGIDSQLMAQYQALDLENKPIKVTYM